MKKQLIILYIIEISLWIIVIVLKILNNFSYVKEVSIIVYIILILVSIIILIITIRKYNHTQKQSKK